MAGHLHEPDFVAETANGIYIVEIKAYNRTDDDEVELKSAAARRYCGHVNALLQGSTQKKWQYILLVDREIARNRDFEDYLR